MGWPGSVDPFQESPYQKTHKTARGLVVKVVMVVNYTHYVWGFCIFLYIAGVTNRLNYPNPRLETTPSMHIAGKANCLNYHKYQKMLPRWRNGEG